MRAIIVCNNPQTLGIDLPGVQVVSARDYLADPAFSAAPGAKVFNLCKSYRYQTAGYYVSLLAMARGHRPLPAVSTIQDLRLQSVIRVASQDLDRLIHRALKPLRSDDFSLSIYFGRNLAARYDDLTLALFNQFPAPFLRARFQRTPGRDWSLHSLRIIGASDVPEPHRPFMIEQARRYFDRSPRRRPRKHLPHDLAILHEPGSHTCPSNPRAIDRFVKSAESHGFRTEIITQDDYGRVSEFDALFIRATTAVNHYTFKFARRASAEGLVVIDDPDSILKCGNKVYLNELLQRHRLRTPKTIVIARDTAHQIVKQIGFPCVVKQPDGSFSTGVSKLENEQHMNECLPALFEGSELLLIQEFVPTAFDWRIGVLNGKPMYACRYHMARKHWQIVKRDGHRTEEGNVDTLAVEDAPTAVVRLGVRAASLIGNGLYGVDIKELKRKPAVIEINDNPNVDAGYEDKVLGQALYDRIMAAMLERVEQARTRTGLTPGNGNA
ncbi:MAG: ATP-grasp domain-containing protein [Planctomycetes bacterium]|nr:ATP-grasp domain-containing protein [Planctomycetota bacterium]NOG55399.1 RimK family protein [Planctomycetota bacterium]